MNKTISNSDLELLIKGLSAAGVNISVKKDDNRDNVMRCSFINSADGTIKWMWPEENGGASLLSFQRSGHVKSPAGTQLMRLCLKLGLGWVIASGRCTLYVDDHSAELMAKLKDWAIYAGKTGEHRKIVAWYENNKGTFFAKIPLSKRSATSIRNEIKALNQYPVTGTHLPQSSVVNHSVLVMPEYYGDSEVKKAHSINSLPIESVIQWSKAGLHKSAINATEWWRASSQRTASFAVRDNKFSAILAERLQQVVASVKENATVLVSKSHGDFTTWNVRYNDEGLHIIDWELYAENKPVLSDVFHFIYQDHILNKNSSYKTIRSAIADYFSNWRWSSFLTDYEINLHEAEKLYLIDNTAYYLDLFNRQTEWDPQVDRMLQTWCEALGYFAFCDSFVNPRQVLYQDMVHYLRNEEYAMMKYDEGSVKELPVSSDVDICMSQDGALQLVQYLKKHVAVSGVKVAARASMRALTIVLKDGSFLYFNCRWQVMKNNIVFADIEDMLRTAYSNSEGIKVPSIFHDVRYLWLSNLLNRTNVPTRHAQRFLNSIHHMAAYARISDEFGLREQPRRTFNYERATHDKVMEKLESSHVNTSWLAVRNAISYGVDAIRSLVPKKGYTMAFSGVDDSGKSTIISTVSKRIERELHLPVVILRQRPSILPVLGGAEQARKGGPDSFPITACEKGGIACWLRFGYYYLDYVLGQFYVQMRYVNRGYVVLYDSYYFDFINDSKRGNITISQSFSEWLYKFLLKPDFNYFLFAPAEGVAQRRKEADTSMVYTMTKNYISLYNNLGRQDKKHTYAAVCNLNNDATLDTIFESIRKHKAGHIR